MFLIRQVLNILIGIKTVFATCMVVVLTSNSPPSPVKHKVQDLNLNYETGPKRDVQEIVHSDKLTR